MADMHNKPNQGGQQGGSQQGGQNRGNQGGGGSAMERAGQAASGVADKARDTASSVADKARDTAGTVAEKARDMASNVGERARDVASTVADRAESATHSVGDGIKSLAGTLRQNVPSDGMLGTAAGTVADTLERGGQYLSEESFGDMTEDLSRVIRQNPIPAVLISVGVGFCLARMLTPRS